MVHPTALTGKTTHSLIDIMNAIIALLKRYYNNDTELSTKYRDIDLPRIANFYKGEPAVIGKTPAVAVVVRDTDFSDAPQDAGADVNSRWEIIYYGDKLTQDDSQTEVIKAAEAIRHIILDYPQLPNDSGTEQVFQANYGDMSFEFDAYVKSAMDEYLGVPIAIIKFTAVFAELGY